MSKKLVRPSLNTEERIACAKLKMDRIVNGMLSLVRQRANNEIVLYTDAISSQVGRSYAGHAFTSLKHVILRHELVSLCSLWDPASGHKGDGDRDSIPSVRELIRDRAVFDALVAETHAVFAHREPRERRPTDDPESHAADEEELARHRRRFADRQAARTSEWLAVAIVRTNEIAEGVVLESVRNFRNRHIAHALTPTVAQETVTPRYVKHGDEKILFDGTLEVVNLLQLGVNGSDFQWDEALANAKRNAEAFWHGIKIDVLE